MIKNINDLYDYINKGIVAYWGDSFSLCFLIWGFTRLVTKHFGISIGHIYIFILCLKSLEQISTSFECSSLRGFSFSRIFVFCFIL